MSQYNILNNISLNYLPEDVVKTAIHSVQHKIISSDIILISVQLYALSADLTKSKKIPLSLLHEFFFCYCFIN